MQISYDGVYDVVVDVVASAAMTERANIRGDQDLIADLNLDSLALFEVVVDLEEAFRLQIADETIEKLHTCSEITQFILRELGDQ